MRESTQQEGRTTPVRRRRWLRWLFLGLGLAVIIPLGAASWLCNAEPCYWQVIDTNDPEVQQSAERVERSVGSKLTRVRPDDERWRMRLSEAQINHWLATRLPKWLRNRGLKAEVLDRIKHPMFDSNADGDPLRIAAKVSASAIGGVVQLGFEPRGTTDDRPVRLKLTEARVGKLPLSVDLLTRLMISGFGATEQDGRRIRELVDSIELKIPLGDGRRVDVIGLEPREDGLTLDCRTVWIEGPRQTQ